MTTQRCSECGREVGTQDEPFRCPTTGRMAQPHVRISRSSPPRPRPQEFTGPDLRLLFNIRRDQRQWRPDRAAVGSYPFCPPSRRAAEAVADNVPAAASAQPTHHQRGTRP